MIEKTIERPQEVYKREVLYMKARQGQSRAFDEMLSLVPEGKKEAREAMRGLWNTEPDELINPEKLVKLREENEPLFKEVLACYMEYLKRALGRD